MTTLVGWAGLKISPVHLRLALPFGISFFTFETMSYTIDVYRREIPPADRYLDYLLFVCFFPHLVAGPIIRYSDILHQFQHTSWTRYRPDWSRLGSQCDDCTRLTESAEQVERQRKHAMVCSSRCRSQSASDCRGALVLLMPRAIRFRQ